MRTIINMIHGLVIFLQKLNTLITFSIHYRDLQNTATIAMNI